MGSTDVYFVTGCSKYAGSSADLVLVIFVHVTVAITHAAEVVFSFTNSDVGGLGASLCSPVYVELRRETY